MLPARIQAFRESIMELPERMRTSVRVARQSGILFELTLSGLGRGALLLARGGRNPSLIFAFHAANAPNKPALLWRDRSVTFADLDDRMNRAAVALGRRRLHLDPRA